MPILYAFEHAPVRFKLRVSVCEHAVNRKLRTNPRGLSHHDVHRIVWERGVWLFLKRWGGYPKWWYSQDTVGLILSRCCHGSGGSEAVRPLTHLHFPLFARV